MIWFSGSVLASAVLVFIAIFCLVLAASWCAVHEMQDESLLIRRQILYESRLYKIVLIQDVVDGAKRTPMNSGYAQI